MTDTAAGDVLRTVHYGRERYWLNRTPLALLGCVVGLFFIAMDPGLPGPAPLIVLAVLAVLGTVYALSVFALHHALGELKPVWTIGFVLALMLSVPAFFFIPSRPYSRGSVADFSENAFGWTILFLSLGFVAYALLLHLRPRRPLITLSPAGLGIDVSWLRDLTIPWREVTHVGAFELHQPGGIVARDPGLPTVSISQAFYAREIEPKRNFLSGQLWSGVFRPIGPNVQMVLPYPWFSIPAQAMQEAVDARWKAFRELPADTLPTAAPAPPLRASNWSVATLSRWHKVFLAVPLAGVLLMLAHFAGVWDTAFLQDARQLSAQARQKAEAARRESQRYKDELRRSNEASEQRQRESEEREREMRRIFDRPPTLTPHGPFPRRIAVAPPPKL